MRVSLIITTYNWKEALAVVLASALLQTRLPDEVIVADDGSSDGTDKLVAKIAARAPIPVIHSWQEDEGFRAAMSRNRAIARATGDYIVLIDGDMLLEKHFIADHIAAARKGWFVQGSRVLFDSHRTEEVLVSGELSACLFSWGIGNRTSSLRSWSLSALFSARSRRVEGIRTCNFAFWRSDALAVNGFDENFEGWGREDSDFAVRLMNAGVRRFNLRFQAVAFHLHHFTRDRQRLSANDELLAQAICSRKVQCQVGINQYLVHGDHAQMFFPPDLPHP